MKILIVGAGISGLSIALALEKIGINPTIVDKSSSLRTDGAGIALPSNAIELLTHLGLGTDILKCAYQVKRITYSLPDNTILSSVALAEYFSKDYPFVALHRKYLIQLIKNHVSSSVKFNTTITKAAHLNKEEILVTFNDGNQQIFNLIIAADGINSSLRKIFSPGTFIEDLGLTIIRFIKSYKQDDPIYYFGKQTAFMIYPINDKQVYCYAHIADSLGDKEKIAYNIQKYFSEYTKEVKYLLMHTSNKKIIFGRLLSVSVPVFFKENIIFIGDASHACSPMLQQGAASALEDAVAFSTILNHTKDIHSAQKHYELFRSPRVNWIKSNSDLPLKLISSYKNEDDYNTLNDYIRDNGPLNVLKWRELFSKSYLEQLHSYINLNLKQLNREKIDVYDYHTNYNPFNFK